MRRNKTASEEQLYKALAKMPEVLERFGYESLRKGQSSAINTILIGQDLLCILPTGRGKSACFTIPTLCMEWKTLVFSPLIALMRDQLKGLYRAGIRAAAINSKQTSGENMDAIRRWQAGDLDLLYVAPERLRDPEFISTLEWQKPDMIVLDEAHTLSDWSDNFRSAYVEVGHLIESLQPKVVAAFTATCPEKVETDIRRVLRIPNATKVVFYPRRKNLILSHSKWVDYNELKRRLSTITGSTIIYCATIKNVEQTYSCLNESKEFRNKVTFFHGKLDANTSRQNQEMFMQGVCPIICATNAFGMGIDKADIRAIIHRDYPQSLEALVQEIGRGGRDGETAVCHTYNDPKTYNIQQFLIEGNHPPAEHVRSVYDFLLRSQDSEGVCQLSTKEIADSLMLRDTHISAALQMLHGAKVISRETGGDAILKIKFISVPQEPRSAGKYHDVYQAVYDMGISATGSDIHEIALNVLLGSVNCSETTLKKYLKQWDKDGHISYVAPSRAAKTKITGHIKDVDFDRLAIKARDAWKKFQAMTDYFKVPDSEKHDYLENYFGITSQDE